MILSMLVLFIFLHFYRYAEGCVSESFYAVCAIMLSGYVVSIFMLSSVLYRYVKCSYAECHFTDFIRFVKC
jgi:hypothetical protein